MNSIISFEEIFEVLKILHYKKTLVYGDSWKKHGELIGIFANISRKYDRISALMRGRKPTSDETIFDTLADLAVYTGKYLTYLAEFYKSIFTEFLSQYASQYNIDQYYHNEGFDPITNILIQHYYNSDLTNKLLTTEDCIKEIHYNFGLLESILVNDDWRNSDIRKCIATANLSVIAVHNILLLAIDTPKRYFLYLKFIDNL